MAAVLVSLAFSALPVTVTPPAGAPGRFGVYELVLTLDDAPYANPFQDVDVTCVFHSPSAADYTVKGFYCAADTWKVRLDVREEGGWTWDLSVNDGFDTFSDSGGFTATGTDGRGFLRVHPTNDARLVFEDGTPCYPAGVQYYSYKVPFIGEHILGGTFAQKISAYFGHYGTLRANIHRRLLGIDDSGGHILLWSDDSGPDRYDLTVADELDTLLSTAHANGMAMILVFYDKVRSWSSNPLNSANGGPCASSGELYSNAQAQDYQKEYFDYCVDRYGVWVDVWQFFNEVGSTDSGLSDAWFNTMYAHIRARDPYDHLINTTWDVGAKAYQDVNAPHWYDTNPDDSAYDQRLLGRFTDNARPCVIDEFGNGPGMPPNAPRRWRIAVWMGLFGEGGIVFWDDSRKVYMSGNANAYLDDSARRSMRVFHDLSGLLPPTMTPVTALVSDSAVARAYALGDSTLDDHALYLFHHIDFGSLCTGLTVDVALPAGDHLARWFDPATGKFLYEETVPGGAATLQVPPFAVDAYCRILGPTRTAARPTAAAGADRVISVGTTVAFDGSGSSDPNSLPLSYWWFFGDGGAARTQSPPHDFTRPGLYDVLLTVDNGSLDDTDGAQALVTGAEFVRDPFEDGDSAGWLPASGEWEVTGGRLAGLRSGMLYEPARTVDDFAAEFNVRLPGGVGWGGMAFRKAAPRDGISASGYLVYINSGGSVVIYDAETGSAAASSPTGLDVVSGFVTVRVEAQGSNVKVYADGTPQLDWTDASAVYTSGYLSLNCNGTGGVWLDDVSVAPLPAQTLAPSSSLSVTPNPADAGNTVWFDGSASSDGDGWIVCYAWDFGDGSPLLATTGPQVMHVYAAAATCQATLYVYDNAGMSATDQVTVTVNASGSNQPPVADIVPSRTEGAAPLAVSFDGSGSDDPDGNIVSFEWDFDYDGITFDVDATGQSASHTFAAPGTYTVALRVTDNEAETDIATVDIAASQGETTVVQLQQGVDGYAGCTDTWVDEYSPDASHGTDAYLDLYYYPASEKSDVLIRFDLSGEVPPGASVSAATLRLWCLRENMGGNDDAAVGLNDASWDGLVTWNTAPSSTATGVALPVGDIYPDSTTHDPPTQYQDFDLSGLLSTVQGWVDDPSSNHGPRLAVGTNLNARWASSEYSDAQKRPLLTIEYAASGNGGGTGCGGGGCAQGGTSAVLLVLYALFRRRGGRPEAVDWNGKAPGLRL